MKPTSHQPMQKKKKKKKSNQDQETPKRQNVLSTNSPTRHLVRFKRTSNMRYRLLPASTYFGSQERTRRARNGIFVTRVRSRRMTTWMSWPKAWIRTLHYSTTRNRRIIYRKPTSTNQLVKKMLSSAFDPKIKNRKKDTNLLKGTPHTWSTSTFMIPFFAFMITTRQHFPAYKITFM